MKILVVDDDRHTIETIKAVLGTLVDCDVVVAKDGQDALGQLMVNNNYDLVILDIMMPGMSGIELCQVMSDDDELSSIPVLLASALITSLSSFKAKNQDLKKFKVVKDAIEKPFNSAELLEKVRQLTGT